MRSQTFPTVHRTLVVLAAPALVFAICAPARTATAASVTLDPSFGAGGLAMVPSIGVFESVAVQTSGKIVAAGRSGCSPVFCGSSVPFLVRFNGDGSLDGTFGAGGIVNVAEFDVRITLPLAIQGDGRILTANPRVARYSADGVFEATFPNDVPLTEHSGTRAFAFAPDGKIVVAIGGGLARYNSDGSYDTSFGTNGVVHPGLGYTQVALQSDGKIVGGGGFGVGRYLADGTLDPIGADGLLLIERGTSSLNVQPGGKILTSGVVNFMAATRSIELRRFNPDGTPDASFGIGGLTITDIGNGGQVGDTLLQSDGKIVVVGSASQGPPFFSAGIFVARYSADGLPDTSFGNAGVALPGNPQSSQSGRGVAVQADGKLIVVGSMADSATGLSGAVVARYVIDASPPNTPAGNDVVVNLGGGAIIQFSSVTSTGVTAVTASGTGPSPPAGFQLGTPAIYYDVTTTAGYGGPVTLCLRYGPTTFPDPNLARLLHNEAGTWLNVTTSNDTTNFIICGVTMSLSPFAIFAAPNDPMFLIDELLLLVRSLDLKHELESRLEAKLSAARDALEGGKPFFGRACKKMDAFSDAVVAASRKLTAQQTGRLLNGASGVQSSLGCL